jgi:poly(A) polymerase
MQGAWINHQVRIGVASLTIYDFATMTKDMTLQPAIKLAAPPWAGYGVLATVMQVLNDQGALPVTLIAGGAVRNAVMNLPINDIDLATQLTPQQVMDRALAAGMKPVPTGIDHGTITVVHDGRGFEVTTLRRDVETDGRHAVVAFTDDWVIDAQRRDFTMNTLLADLSGQVFDPLGTGVRDALSGAVRFVGDPDQRIAEDNLRILRFFRFQAIYGRVPLEPMAIAACKAAASQMRILSRERITHEFLRWLGAKDPSQTIDIAIYNNILQPLFHVKHDLMPLSRLCHLQNKTGMIEILSRLLLVVDGNDFTQSSTILLSTRKNKFLQTLASIKAEDVATDHAARCAVYHYGRDVTVQAVLLQAAYAAENIPAWLPDIVAWPIPAFPLNGDELMKAGIEAGPDLGARLKRAESAWMQSDFTLDKDAIKAIALA